ncbi:MAG TPA: ECF transporter S component [Clostridiales bacterium]|nr:ECF transporter S component [Clostridiales bacterium]
MRDNKTRILTVSALMTAFVYIATYIGTALPFSGYAHLGDAAVFLSGLILGPHYGFIAAALGSALADGLKSFVIYIPVTFILKGLMAYMTGRVREKGSKTITSAMILGGSIMVIGYYLYEAFIYGSIQAPIINIPWNIIQFVIGIIVAKILFKPFARFKL